MPTRDNPELHDAVKRLRDCDELDLDDALALAETSVRALTRHAAAKCAVTENKLQTVAGKVARLKEGISLLQANHLRDIHIPEAGRELEETLAATETAASTIMEAAETIMDADRSCPDAYLETVNAGLMAIFEACAFQDITGQRISKVQENLDSIETRVSRFADNVEVPDSDDPACDKEAKRNKRKKDLILNGPAGDGEGVSQDEIDSLLAG